MAQMQAHLTSNQLSLLLTTMRNRRDRVECSARPNQNEKPLVFGPKNKGRQTKQTTNKK